MFEGALLPAAMAGLADTVPGDKRATTSSAVIAGCYVGSAFAFASAAVLFSSTNVFISNWPNVFYVNGLLVGLYLLFFREEFVAPDISSLPKAENIISSLTSLVLDAVDVARATVKSSSGRAILAAQVGQGALIFTLSTWGPLYLERGVEGCASGSAIGTTTTAGSAALTLIFPQITQAALGVSVFVYFEVYVSCYFILG